MCNCPRCDEPEASVGPIAPSRVVDMTLDDVALVMGVTLQTCPGCSRRVSPRVTPNGNKCQACGREWAPRHAGLMGVAR